MTKQGTGQHAGVNAPDTGPVTLRDILAAQRAVERAERTPTEKRAIRDELIRQALAAGIVTKAELRRQLSISEQHLGRIEKGTRPDRPNP
jgi:hypothetical protein